MKLRVDEITAESRNFAFAEPADEINRALASGPVHEYRLMRPAEVDIACYRAGTELFVEGTIAVAANASCARCAEDFPMTTHRRFRYVLAPRVIGDEAEGDLRRDDLEFTLYSGDEVDLTPMVREQVFLALTGRPLCRDDCAGLCARCGANLNEGRCACRAETHDPRLAVLRSLKVSRA